MKFQDFDIIGIWFFLLMFFNTAVFLLYEGLKKEPKKCYYVVSKFRDERAVLFTDIEVARRYTEAKNKERISKPYFITENPKMYEPR